MILEYDYCLAETQFQDIVDLNKSYIDGDIERYLLWMIINKNGTFEFDTYFIHDCEEGRYAFCDEMSAGAWDANDDFDDLEFIVKDFKTVDEAMEYRYVHYEKVNELNPELFI